MTIILCANEKIQTDIKYLGFRGVLPKDVAEALREQAKGAKKDDLERAQDKS